ncbi:hypothetical protein CBL_08160 [Carabus blaptoides fortunei]
MPKCEARVHSERAPVNEVSPITAQLGQEKRRPSSLVGCNQTPGLQIANGSRTVIYAPGETERFKTSFPLDCGNIRDSKSEISNQQDREARYCYSSCPSVSFHVSHIRAHKHCPPIPITHPLLKNTQTRIRSDYYF